MFSLLVTVSLNETYQNLKWSECYTLTYWGIGIMMVILFIIRMATDAKMNDFVTLLAILTLTAVAVVEMYHSHDVLTKEAIAQERNTLQELEEVKRIKGCHFELANTEAHKFMRSSGFVILQNHAPTYSTLADKNSAEVTCEARYTYTIQDPQHTILTEEIKGDNNLHEVSLVLDQHGAGALKNYALVEAYIKNISTNTSRNILE